MRDMKRVVADTLSIREAAVELGVASDRVYRLLWDGKLPGTAKDPNGHWRIPRKAVKAWQTIPIARTTGQPDRRRRAAKQQAEVAT